METSVERQAPKAIYLKDYTPPDYLIERVDLRFELDEDAITVRARLAIKRNPARGGEARPLVLDGRELELLSLRMNGLEVERDCYRLDDEHLVLLQIPAAFDLEIVTRIRPQDNTSLEGLYRSGGNFCTQCEAEGFRKITYFADRPDVMAVYTTTLVADQSRYPVLLSNGNLIDSGKLDDGRHWATWHDPFKKPSYLFALVAGHLKCVEDSYTTRSGRRIMLRIYVEPENVEQCGHALQSLKKAMAWDEQEFGLEYDLDIYMIVAVGDFNMGAMENKGLNIFNTQYVLAKPETATDDDYQHIEGVVGHEYFHNWTGNRVTCRDWFQLSLKEGLTVFRDQEFSADMGSRGVKRIEDVRILRTSQFAQDAGPLAHPVRPQSYIEINNFYTVTVYNKGAEVIRMIRTLVGKPGFRRGMELYLRRHDGQAVTTDDFVAAMADANGIDLTQFKRWYDQAGTPELTVSDAYDAEAGVYTLTVRQSCPPTPGQTHKAPFHIPLTVGLLDLRGHDLPLRLEGEEESRQETTRILELREPEHRFRFVDIPERPVPSLLRDFSAPAKLRMERSDDDLIFLLSHDSDEFNRWEAGQVLAVRTILGLIGDRRQGRPWTLPGSFNAAFGRVLADQAVDPALRAHILSLPSENYLAEQMAVIDVEGIHQARHFVRRALAESLRVDWLTAFETYQDLEPYRNDADAIARRRLKNRCLDYLMQLDEATGRALCVEQFRRADNMTDRIAALRLLANCECPEREEALETFYARWRHEPLVVDKWFTIQATSQLPGTLNEVKQLLHHTSFTIKNPNKVRALIGAFCQGNPVRFHAPDGSGYAFLSQQVLTLNKLNPQIAARLVGAFTQWRKYDSRRRAMMREHLEGILRSPGLSRDVYEIALKSLEDKER